MHDPATRPSEIVNSFTECRVSCRPTAHRKGVHCALTARHRWPAHDGAAPPRPCPGPRGGLVRHRTLRRSHHPADAARGLPGRGPHRAVLAGHRAGHRGRRRALLAWIRQAPGGLGVVEVDGRRRGRLGPRLQFPSLCGAQRQQREIERYPRQPYRHRHGQAGHQRIGSAQAKQHGGNAQCDEHASDESGSPTRGVRVQTDHQHEESPRKSRISVAPGRRRAAAAARRAATPGPRP